jgi:hypothetical protein
VIPVIACKYSCPLCGLRRVTVYVSIRLNEDVVEWMNKQVTPALMRDHEFRSPGCRATEFSEVMIPVTGANKIGGPTIQ